MNEWIIASGVLTLFLMVVGFIFKWGWNIIQDVKKSAHARLDRLEIRQHELDRNCSERKDNVNDNLNTGFTQVRNEMTTGFGNINGRIDGLILTLNGRKNKE